MDKLELNEIITSIVEDTGYKIPTKLSAKNKRFEGRRCKIHKYVRFNANHKTYDTTKYYCTNCPSLIDIHMILGRMTECWKCGVGFKVSIGNFPNRPVCEDCKNKRARVTNLSSNDDKTKTEILDMIMKKVGL